jgi:phospholipid-binding lipoprotein MlaA
MLTPAFSLFARAHVPSDPEARAVYEPNSDPAEPTNRTIFAGNQLRDRHVLKPVARGYEDYVSGRVTNGLHNFASDLGQPAVTNHKGDVTPPRRSAQAAIGAGAD